MKFLIMLNLLLSAFCAIGDSIIVTDAWIKNLPPTVPMRAGYMKLENTSAKSLSIVAVESDIFMHIDIHETVEKNGMMSMQPVPALPIPAGKAVELAPGGIHLMMMKPKETLKPGDQVSITLKFDDDSTQTLQMTVKK
jgi:copper(I)-binding protein